MRKCVTVDRKCDSHQEVMGRSKGAWGGVSSERKSDSHRGGVEGIKMTVS